MTPTPRTYRTGFEQVFDCPAGRRILAQLRAATPSAAVGPGPHAETGPVTSRGDAAIAPVATTSSLS